jgi:hypothetical protein|tara:strand:- start:2492 stop:2854 length:363 start_codon:yes stop_codon:yes gene_type:complete
MKFEQLVRYTLEYSNQLRYYHWQTSSFAQHEALGKFYDSITAILDGLVETWSGRLGNIKVDQGSVELVDYTDVESVIESAVSLRDAYEEFSKTISYDDIRDQIDDMITSINQTIYLLRLK